MPGAAAASAALTSRAERSRGWARGRRAAALLPSSSSLGEDRATAAGRQTRRRLTVARGRRAAGQPASRGGAGATTRRSRGEQSARPGSSRVGTASAGAGLAGSRARGRERARERPRLARRVGRRRAREPAREAAPPSRCLQWKRPQAGNPGLVPGRRVCERVFRENVRPQGGPRPRAGVEISHRRARATVVATAGGSGSSGTRRSHWRSSEPARDAC